MARSMVVILCPHPEDEVRECDAENCHAAKERIGDPLRVLFGDPLRVLFGLRFIFRKRHPFPNDLPVRQHRAATPTSMSQRNLGRRRLDVVSPQRPFTSTGAHCFASPTRRVLRAGQVSQIFVDGRQFFIIHSSERVTRNGRICGRFYPAISVRRLGSHLPQAGRSGRSA